MLITAIIALVLASLLYARPVFSNDIITCESHKQRYVTCPIQSHGYVRLRKQLSRADCIQGRTWDYDRRQIWVDENCKGEFEVEIRHHTNGHSDHTGEKAVAAAAAIALIAAVASNNNNHEKADNKGRYNDDNYHGGRHSSYVPHWMTGEFEGYNIKYDAKVTMRISDDGRMSANVDGTNLRGYINDERLYIGDEEFYIDRAGDGFNTTQVNDTHNQVHYSRVR